MRRAPLVLLAIVPHLCGPALRAPAASAGMDLPASATRGRYTLEVSRAGRVSLSLDGLTLVTLGLTLTDGGGFMDQRPAYVSVDAAGEAGTTFRLSVTGILTTRAGTVFDLREDIALDADGAAVSFELAPRTECAVEILELGFVLPIDHFAEGRVVARDGGGNARTWPLPADRDAAILGSATIARASIEFGKGNALELDRIRGSGSAILWDMRGWSLDWYKLSFRLASGKLAARTPSRLEVRLGTRHGLRDADLLGKLQQAREAGKARFLEDLRARFRSNVLPLRPFDFEHADWQALRKHGLEGIVPYLAQVCDLIDMDPESRTFGYMDLHWRDGIGPGNATYVETMQPLACAWSTPGAWNPYYHDAALMQRIEAMAIHYCELVGLSGASGGPWSHPLARIAESYYRVGASVTPQIAAAWVDRMLRRAEYLGERMPVNGQCTNQQAEGLHALQWTYRATSDERVPVWIAALKRRYLREAIQPPGYPVEMQGPDYYYQNVSVMALYWYYQLSRDADIRAAVRDRIIPWYAYVTLPEPASGGGAGMLTGIRGHDTRTQGFARPYVPWLFNWAGYGVQSARAFQAAATSRRRSTPAPVSAEPMPRAPTQALVGRGLWTNHVWKLPEAILNDIGGLRDTAPLTIDEVLDARRAVLACFREPFSQRLSDHYGGEYLFLRRPAYYAAVSWGPVIQAKQRKGGGLQAVWAPAIGTVVLSQNRQGPSHELVLSRVGDDERYHGARSNPVVALGPDESPCRQLRASWSLKGAPCERLIVFHDDAVAVRVSHEPVPGAPDQEAWRFEEVIPLMMDGGTELVAQGNDGADVVSGPREGVEARAIVLRRHGREARIAFETTARIDIDPAAFKDPSAYANAAGIAIARIAVRVPAEGTLTYRIEPGD